MSLELLTVRGKKIGIKNTKRLASVSECYNTTDIASAIPSVCYINGTISDGLVNSEVVIRGGKHGSDIKLWVTQSVSTIAALA
jgi:hypothetical protein